MNRNHALFLGVLFLFLNGVYFNGVFSWNQQAQQPLVLDTLTEGVSNQIKNSCKGERHFFECAETKARAYVANESL